MCQLKYVQFPNSNGNFEISTGLAPLRCVCGPRTWHKIDESMIDPAKRQGLGPRISYKVFFILHKNLLEKNMKLVHF